MISILTGYVALETKPGIEAAVIPVSAPSPRTFVVIGQKCIKRAIFLASERQELRIRFKMFPATRFPWRP
jgi:hypothetical protein